MHRCIVFLLCCFSISAFTQDIQTQEAKQHSPQRAAIYSAILPGTGQIYNKKYWKAPIVYAAFGTLGYFIHDNNSQYKQFREAYKIRTDNNSGTIDKFADKYTDENLKALRDYYRRNVELSIIMTAFVYILNIIDASVDAHLFGFNVSDDLSLNIEPIYRPLNTPDISSAQIKLTLKF
jgi:hypothetical protein